MPSCRPILFQSSTQHHRVITKFIKKEKNFGVIAFLSFCAQTVEQSAPSSTEVGMITPKIDNKQIKRRKKQNLENQSKHDCTSEMFDFLFFFGGGHNFVHSLLCTCSEHAITQHKHIHIIQILITIFILIIKTLITIISIIQCVGQSIITKPAMFAPSSFGMLCSASQLSK